MPSYYGPPRACWSAHAAGAKVILTQNGRTACGPCVTIRAPIGNKARADTALASRADGGPPGGCGFAILVPELVQTASTGHGPITGPWHRLADAMVRRFAAVTGQNVSTVPKVFTACANMRNAQDTVKVTSAHRRQLAARGSPIRSAPSPA